MIFYSKVIFYKISYQFFAISTKKYDKNGNIMQKMHNIMQLNC